MLIDSLVSFVPIGAPLSMVLGAGIAAPSNVYDLLGLGVGVAPSERIIGQPSTGVFGEDAGIGGKKPQVQVNVGIGFVTANAATLNVAFQGAADTGSAGNYQPGTWQTFVETGALTAAQLAAQTILGRFDFPPAFPANFSPRFLRLLFQVPAATNFTAGSIASAIVTMVRDDLAQKFAARNYAAASVG